MMWWLILLATVVVIILILLYLKYRHDYGSIVERWKLGKPVQNIRPKTADEYFIRGLSEIHQQINDNTPKVEITPQTQLDFEIALSLAFNEGTRLFPQFMHQRINELGMRVSVQPLPQNKSHSLQNAVAILDAGAKQITNDPENVHDTKVNNGLRDTLAVLRAECTPQPNFMEEVARAAINNGPAKAALLDFTGEFNHTFRCTDYEALSLVWARSLQEGQNRELIQSAVITALADCREDGKTVCSNGRIARILSSLAMCDRNPAMGVVKSYELYRAEVFNDVNKMILAENFDLEVTVEKRMEFGKRIESHLEKNYGGVLSVEERAKILAECMAAF